LIRSPESKVTCGSTSRSTAARQEGLVLRPDVARRRTILLGRDPRDAWAITQRICGVCTTVHAIASVRAVENALQMEIPLNAQYIRNMIILAHAVHDHIVHFYHLSALDWVDVASAPSRPTPARRAALAESLSVLAGQQQARDAPRAGALTGISSAASSASSPTVTGATRR
jgi:Ni,Fe-hydrogenase I large subunit